MQPVSLPPPLASIPPMTLDQPTLDSLDELADEDEDVLGEIVKLYLVDAQRTLEDAWAASSARDALELTKATHKLKSSSAYVGALRVSKVAAALERCGRDGELAHVPGLMRRLDTEIKVAFVALRGLRPGL